MNKALFLDRDGIINVDHGYVYRIDEFEFMPGIFTLCKEAQDKGYLIVVITNQSGIARGKYTEQDFHTLTSWMKEQFLTHQVKISDVFYCPHHPQKGTGIYLKSCRCRKPEPGMINTAVTKYNIKVEESFFIGDKISDMQAAIAAGVKNKFLLTDSNPENNELDINVISNISQFSSFIG